VIEVVGDPDADLDASYQSEFDGSYARSGWVNHRASWLRLSNGNRMDYDPEAMEWQITAKSTRLAVWSLDGMPPSLGHWTSSDHELVDVLLTTECKELTEEPTMPPSSEPTWTPTGNPTHPSSEPTSHPTQPTAVPTTAWPSTGRPTLPHALGIGECSDWETFHVLEAVLSLTGWNQTEDTEQAVAHLAEDSFVTAVLKVTTDWDERYCFSTTSFEFSTRRRRLSDSEVEVAMEFTMNDVLYNDYFTRSTTTVFMADFTEYFGNELADRNEGGGGRVSGFMVDHEIAAFYNASSPTSAPSEGLAFGFGIHDRCDAWGFVCWQLYTILGCVALFMCCGVLCTCRWTHTEINKIYGRRYHDLDSLENLQNTAERENIDL